ncbi:CPA1 family monovalent cation:H+ antiporter [Larkinella arboricola]|uniref:CPA1 family monovalent cation:H+ antiporter n=1 Tax=Larkinella arboricola TaxID=643671 RepID=A0A327WLE3_LARAB|nr:Na+/H+ antiporter [Larkinella arboricola]RAJ92669.1 CPA1 family monovalent cation:H+ antiporter [Larkinella arboricola]
MTEIEIVLVLMAILTALAWVTQNLKIPQSILLLTAGLVLGFSPSIPEIHLESETVLLIFLPPLLYEAAGNISWHEFKAYRRPITMLAVWLVFFTTVAVAAVAHYFIPGFTWPLAFVLGAIISPPDAVAATSTIRGLSLPSRLITILEGESLVNDASALVAYRYAVGAVTSGGFVLWQAGWQFLVIAAGGIITGLAIGYIFTHIHNKLENPTVATAITLLMPFVTYLLAEQLHLSGVLAVVSMGLYMAWHSYEIFSFQTRMQINSFWNILVFLLNGFVFILIGSQLPIVVNAIGRESILTWIGYGFLVSLVAIAARIIWIFPLEYLYRLLGTRRKKSAQFSPSELFITSWAGMRGVVSLATALALPFTLRNGQAFPMRNEVLFLSFMVIFVTLVLQGLTLPFFIRRLGVNEPTHIGELEEKRVRMKITSSSIAFIESELALTLHDEVLNELKSRFEQHSNYLQGILRLDERPRKGDPLTAPTFFREFVQSELAVVNHQRHLIIQWHKEGTYSEEIIRRIEQELDIRTLSLQTQLRRLQPIGADNEAGGAV